MPGVILTATPTPKEIRARLLVLFTQLTVAHPTVLKSIDLDGTCEIGDEYLPVLIGLATRGVVGTEKHSNQITDVTRNYEYRVLYKKVASSALADQLAAVQAAE